jgi:hypothetical protein
LGPKRQRWDIADAFESIGAATAIATTLEQALVEVEAQDLKAAVVDHVLGPPVL